MEVLNSRLNHSDPAPHTCKPELDKVNELIDSVLDSWKDKAENFLIAEIEEIYTTKDWRTLILFCQHMGSSQLISPRTIQLLFTFINLVCKLPSLREVLVLYSLNGISAWIAFSNALNFQLSLLVSADFERSESVAKILGLLIVLISDETWEDLRPNERQRGVLRRSMIG